MKDDAGLPEQNGAVVMEASVLTPEEQIQALESVLANQNITLLFQGSLVGLVLGGSTAWIVAKNIRTR